MKAKIIIASILLGISFNACQKEVSIDIPTLNEPSLFIEGMLFPDQPPQIYLSRSIAFFSKEVAPQDIFVRGAEVQISDGNIVEILQADSTFNKFRCRWEPFYGGSVLPKAGGTYILEINYAGKTYKASTTLNQRKVNIQEINYTAEFFDVYGGHDGVVITIKDSEGLGDNYRFQMDRMIDKSVFHAHSLDGFINNCAEEEELFFVRDLGRIIFTDEKVDGQILEMNMEVSYEYSEGDEAWVFMQSIDARSAAFYQNLDDQLVALNNPFVEPIFIETQIEGAVGVFGSGILSDSILFIYPQDNP